MKLQAAKSHLCRLTLASALSLGMALNILFGLLVVLVYPVFAITGRLARDGSRPASAGTDATTFRTARGRSRSRLG